MEMDLAEAMAAIEEATAFDPNNQGTDETTSHDIVAAEDTIAEDIIAEDMIADASSDVVRTESAVNTGVIPNEELSSEDAFSDCEWEHYVHIEQVFPSAIPTSNMYSLHYLSPDIHKLAAVIGHQQEVCSRISDSQITMEIFEWSARHDILRKQVVKYLVSSVILS